MKNEESARFAVWLPKEMIKKLDVIAKENGHTKGSYLRWLLMQDIKKQETKTL